MMLQKKAVKDVLTWADCFRGHRQKSLSVPKALAGHM